MDQVIQEMQRASEVRPAVIRRWARHLREVVQPQLDELAQLKEQQAAKAPSKKAKETV